MSSRPYQLIVHLHDGELAIPHPTAEDVLRALRHLRDDSGYLVDLNTDDGTTVLQIVADDGPQGLGLAAWPGGARSGHYSASAELGDDDIVATCMAFMASGDLADAPVPFVPEECTTWGRPPEPEPDARARLRDDPQGRLAFWMETGGYLDPTRLADAIARGASFETFSPLPPLIYLARRHGAYDTAIAPLLALGCSLATLHDGRTALWHAVECHNYRFASALVRHGASPAEAAASRNADSWRRDDQQRSMLRAIEAGDLAGVRAWLDGRRSGEVGYEQLELAMRRGQLAVFELLLAHKGRLRFRTAGFGPWAGAMALADTRYLDALVRHGAYQSIAALPDYGGREFVGASAQGLRYLLERGMTAGFGRGFAVIVAALAPHHAPALMAFPDSYFHGLEPDAMVRIIDLLATSDPERIDRLLDHADFAALVGHAFSLPATGRSPMLIARLFGHDMACPGWEMILGDPQAYVNAVGFELAALAGAIACD